MFFFLIRVMLVILNEWNRFNGVPESRSSQWLYVCTWHAFIFPSLFTTQYYVYLATSTQLGSRNQPLIQLLEFVNYLLRSYVVVSAIENVAIYVATQVGRQVELYKACRYICNSIFPFVLGKTIRCVQPTSALRAQQPRERSQSE